LNKRKPSNAWPNKTSSMSVALGTILGPAFYFLSPEWCILFGGFIAGTIAFLFGEKNGK